MLKVLKIYMHLLSIYFVSVVKPAQNAQFGGGVTGWDGRGGRVPNLAYLKS